MPDPLGFTGPSEEYVPIQGTGSNYGPISPIQSNPAPTYADINYLNQILATLVIQCNTLIKEMGTVLQDLALVVTTNPADTNLQNAHEVLWPSSLGPAPSYITYLYYLSLSGINSAAATFVRNAYETAARGVTGSNAIDLLPITQMTLNEANLIQDFADTYAGALSDSSQRRTVELLQDWVESATQQITNIQTQFQNSSQSQLSTTEVSSLSTQDASNTQAIMQVNLNQLNIQLVKSLGVLQKYFATYQSTFYNNVLGPSMGFRNNVITNMYPILPGNLGTVVNTSTNIINTNLQNVLADQLRRNTIYTTQVQNIITTVQARDGYRNYIVQLATTGQSVPSGSQGTMIAASDTPAQAAYFQAATAPDATPSNPYTAPHSQLSGLSDPLAHSQYLLKAGDTMEGNLELATPNSIDPTGVEVLIDGMRPSTHAHTGTDGTVQISTVAIGTSPGPPTTGMQGQQYLDSNNILYVCTTTGPPSIWVAIN